MPYREPVSFGPRLREMRTDASLTQAELAERVGTSQGYVSELEADRFSPSRDTILRLARALDVDPCVLFGCLPLAAEAV